MILRLELSLQRGMGHHVWKMKKRVKELKEMKSRQMRHLRKKRSRVKWSDICASNFFYLRKEVLSSVS